VGRESSLALVNSLQGDEKLLGVVAQLDPRVEDPAAADLHKLGTLAKVHKTVKMPNGNVVIFLEGLQRIQVLELIGLRPFLQARVQAEPDIIGEADTELESTAAKSQELFRDVVSHSPQLSDESAIRGSEHRSSGPPDGFHRRHTCPSAFDAAAPGIDRDLQRTQEARNPDPRTIEGA